MIETAIRAIHSHHLGLLFTDWGITIDQLHKLFVRLAPGLTRTMRGHVQSESMSVSPLSFTLQAHVFITRILELLCCLQQRRCFHCATPFAHSFASCATTPDTAARDG